MRPTIHPRLVNGRFGDPALFIELLHRRDAVLFDMGDLSALSARDLLRVSHIAVSHMHIDHWIGFDALLRVSVGREKRICMVGPAGFTETVGHKLAGYSWDLVDRYDVDLVFEVSELVSAETVKLSRFRFKKGFAAEDCGERRAEDGLIFSGPGFEVQAVILEHHGPCLAFAISEQVHVNIWRNRLDERGLPVGAWLQNLKTAVREDRPDNHAIALPDGRAVPLGSLRDVVSIEAGQKVVYVTDVADTAANRTAIAALAADADLLFIEARFSEADAAHAASRAHLTTRAAGEIAARSAVRRVEPFHFSPRYDGAEQQMLDEVKSAFIGS